MDIATYIFTGFCSETEKDHGETLSIIKQVNFDMAYMFHYSERPGTLAERQYEDDVSVEVKKKRLSEIIELQRQISFDNNNKDVGKTFKVLVEGVSKKSDRQLFGRNSQNKVIVFSKGNDKKGDYVMVKVEGFTSGTLKGISI